MIYAINNTGNDILKDQKLWLNKHYLNRNDAIQKQSDGQNKMGIPVFDENNNILICHIVDYTNYKYIYNTSAKTWEKGSSVGVARCTHVIYNDDGSIILHNGHAVTNYKDTPTAVLDTVALKSETKEGIIINNTYTMNCLAPGSFNLYKNNKFVCAFNGEYAGNTLTNAFIQGNILCYIFGNNVVFVDITTPEQPIILRKAYVPYSGADDCHIMYMTGLGPNNYMITYNSRSPSYEVHNLLIYKINANYSISIANDLPESLQSHINTPCRVTFFNNSNILTLGDRSNVYAYKFENGKFINMKLRLTLPTEMSALHEKDAYALYISKDLTSAVITYRVPSSSYVYSTNIFFKLGTSSSDWYADNYELISEDTIIGYATGNQNLEEKYEVETLIPPKSTTTITVTPDADEFYIDGVKK